MHINKNKINFSEKEIKTNYINYVFENDIANWNISFLANQKLDITDIEDVALDIIYGAPMTVFLIHSEVISGSHKLNITDKEQEKRFAILYSLYSKDKENTMADDVKIFINEEHSFTFKSINDKKERMRLERTLKDVLSVDDFTFFENVCYNILNSKIAFQFLIDLQSVETFKFLK